MSKWGDNILGSFQSDRRRGKMLVFVIPLKSPQVSQSWERVCKLLERTVRSVCNQTSSEFRVIVVCHEKPIIEFNHPHLTYLKVDFPLPKEKNSIARGDTDKGRKILAGLIQAQQFSPSHTMAVDADDCVSKYLAEFVYKHPESNGWFINRGYKYQEDRKILYIKRWHFYRMCGSCNILRYDLNELPKIPEYNRGYGYYKNYILHAKIKEFLTKKGTPIMPLPFAGAVYIIGNGDNISGNEKNLSFHFLNRRVLTPSIREEFSLHT
jgi:hypothetical protein